MMAAADRLSALPDDALQRVLSYAPAREAAASAILSRRWRTLWSRTTAINLDSRPYSKAERDQGCYVPNFQAFFRDAHAAIAQRRRGGGMGLVKRLTLFLETATYRRPNSSIRTCGAEPEQDRRAVLAGLLADPAVAGLEELSIASQDQSYLGRYDPPMASLSCAATLRVLDLRFCDFLSSSPSPHDLAFPSLTDLTLRNCLFADGYLQAMVDAAPALASMTIVNIRQRSAKPPKGPFYHPKDLCVPLRLRCPTATVLVIVETDVKVEELNESADAGIELDMPSLRAFRYRGYPIKLSLTSPAPELARVDLDVAQRHTLGYWDMKYEPPSSMLATFASTRALKLRLRYIEDLLFDEHNNQHRGVVVLLPTFPNLELLEIDAAFQYDYRNTNTAVATAALLRSCPAMSELRLRLAMHRNYCYPDPVGGGPFEESVERFERLVSKSSPQRAAIQLDGVSELPDVFTTKSGAFRCMQKSLRKVTMQFTSKEINCFQVQLAKFLVENAMVLEEMHIDDGSQFLPDHLLDKVERWRADAFQRRNLQPDTAAAAGFRAYQLASPVADSGKPFG